MTFPKKKTWHTGSYGIACTHHFRCPKRSACSKGQSTGTFNGHIYQQPPMEGSDFALKISMEASILKASGPWGFWGGYP